MPKHFIASPNTHLIPKLKQLAPAPLDAVNVFFGGDVWHSLTTQVGGTPTTK